MKEKKTHKLNSLPRGKSGKTKLKKEKIENLVIYGKIPPELCV